MTVKESVNETVSDCAAEGSFPTGYELNQEIGDGGTAALYTCAVLVLIVNLVLFILLIIKFTKTLPHSQVKYLTPLKFSDTSELYRSLKHVGSHPYSPSPPL